MHHKPAALATLVEIMDEEEPCSPHNYIYFEISDRPNKNNSNNRTKWKVQSFAKENVLAITEVLPLAETSTRLIENLNVICNSTNGGSEKKNRYIYSRRISKS